MFQILTGKLWTAGRGRPKAPPGGSRRRLGLWPLLLAALLSSPAGGEGGYQAEQVHAAFLYNLARFVSWPAGSFDTPRSPITICFLGSTPVVDLLQQAAAGERIQGRPLTTLQLTSLEAVDDCHMLFLNPLSARLHSDRLDRLHDKPVLLVSTLSRFAESGGMLALEERERHIHPVINLQAVNRARIVISSKLLRLATIIQGDP